MLDNSAANMSPYSLTTDQDIEEQNFIQMRQLATGLVDLIENNNQFKELLLQTLRMRNDTEEERSVGLEKHRRFMNNKKYQYTHLNGREGNTSE